MFAHISLEMNLSEIIMNPNSGARGWVWGGFSPLWAQSIRAIDAGSVLRPSIFLTWAAVAIDPFCFLLGWTNPFAFIPANSMSDCEYCFFWGV